MNIHKLDLDLVYREGDPIIIPALIPPIPFSKRIGIKDAEHIFDKIAKHNFGNTGPRGMTYGGWGPRTWGPWKIDPFLQTKSGKYDLDKRNPEHREMLLKRIGFCVERRLMYPTSIHDNSQFHYDPRRPNAYPGHWNMSFWNGRNNINGTSTLKKAVFHAYEEDNINKPDFQRTWMYMMEYERWFIELMEEYFKGWVIYEAYNEPHAGQDWHKIQADLFDELKIPKWRRFTSTDIRKKPGVYDWFMYSLHGCHNYEAYKKRKKEKLGNFAHNSIIVSQDGCYPTETPLETKYFVYNILKDGERGIELNLRPIHVYENGQWITTDNPDMSLRNLPWKWMKKLRAGWFKWMREQ